MTALPTSLSLTSIADGALAIAADHRNNYAALQTGVNTLIDCLNDGVAGQVVKGVGTTITFDYPPGYDFAEAEIAAPVNVVATSEATATTIVTLAAITLDGATPVYIEFHSPYIAKGTTFTRLYLYDGAASIGFIGHVDGSGPVTVATRLTPSAIAHTYSIRGSVDAGTGVVQAGNGTIGNYRAAYVRVYRA